MNFTGFYNSNGGKNTDGVSNNSALVSVIEASISDNITDKYFERIRNAKRTIWGEMISAEGINLDVTLRDLFIFDRSKKPFTNFRLNYQLRTQGGTHRHLKQEFSDLLNEHRRRKNVRFIFSAFAEGLYELSSLNTEMTIRELFEIPEEELKQIMVLKDLGGEKYSAFENDRRLLMEIMEYEP